MIVECNCGHYSDFHTEEGCQEFNGDNLCRCNYTREQCEQLFNGFGDEFLSNDEDDEE